MHARVWCSFPVTCIGRGKGILCLALNNLSLGNITSDQLQTSHHSYLICGIGSFGWNHIGDEELNCAWCWLWWGAESLWTQRHSNYGSNNPLKKFHFESVNEEKYKELKNNYNHSKRTISFFYKRVWRQKSWFSHLYKPNASTFANRAKACK